MGRNKGQEYEDKIVKILEDKKLFPLHLKNNMQGNDAAIVHKGATYFVEVKNRDAPDYGQKRLVWDQLTKWQWSENDIIAQLFTQYGIVNQHINPGFIPKRYSVLPKENITAADKRFDQIAFKKNGIPIPNTCLHDFYARRNCYYIQIEGKGFYHLQRDIAQLGVPQYKPDLYLRLRAKTHSSSPIYNYSFFAVINADKNSASITGFDLEELGGKSFPPIQ
jgi:Holliday junction resolvase-like predicted endonuclease